MDAACFETDLERELTATQLLDEGILAIRHQSFEWAIVLFTALIEQSSIQPIPLIKSHYHRGCALCQLTRYEEAIADFTQVLHFSEAPTLEQATLERASLEQSILYQAEITLSAPYIHRGNAYRHLGHYSRALSDLNLAVELAGGSAQSFGCRGLVKLDMNDFVGAIADFNAAIALHPTFAQGYLWRGFAWLGRHQAEPARADLTRAIAAIPNCAEAYNHRGVAQFYLNQFEAAIADFDQAIRLNHQFAEAYNNRGNLRQLLGDHTGASADYDRAMSLDQDLYARCFNQASDADVMTDLAINNAAVYRHRAQMQAAQGEFALAIADCTTAISIIPTANAYYQRGLAYVAVGDEQQAMADFDCAIEQSPDFGVAYGDRAHLHYRLHNTESAIYDCDQALSMPQGLENQKQLYATRCLANFCQQKSTEAIADFEQLIALFIQSSSSSQTSKDSTSIVSSEACGRLNRFSV